MLVKGVPDVIGKSQNISDVSHESLITDDIMIHAVVVNHKENSKLRIPCHDKPISTHVYSISQEICTRFLLCCALLWLYID